MPSAAAWSSLYVRTDAESLPYSGFVMDAGADRSKPRIDVASLWWAAHYRVDWRHEQLRRTFRFKGTLLAIEESARGGRGHRAADVARVRGEAPVRSCHGAARGAGDHPDDRTGLIRSGATLTPHVGRRRVDGEGGERGPGGRRRRHGRRVGVVVRRHERRASGSSSWRRTWRARERRAARRAWCARRAARRPRSRSAGSRSTSTVRSRRAWGRTPGSASSAT